MTAGEQFIKMIRPVGCVLFLVVLVLFLFLAFGSGGGEVLSLGDYAPPEGLDTGDPLALAEELTAHVLPLLPGNNNCYVSDGKLFVELSGDHFADCRATILEYYPHSGIQFLRK